MIAVDLKALRIKFEEKDLTGVIALLDLLNKETVQHGEQIEDIRPSSFDERTKLCLAIVQEAISKKFTIDGPQTALLSIGGNRCTWAEWLEMFSVVMNDIDSATIRHFDALCDAMSLWVGNAQERIRKIENVDGHLPQTRYDTPFDDITGPLNPNNG